jgi:hypothetical protein
MAAGIASRRVLYPALLYTAPSVLVIGVPPQNRGAGLALDRYYANIIETDAELDAIQPFPNF